MAVNRKLLQGAAGAAGGLVPSEHFGVVLYEGDGSSSHSINGGKFGAGGYFNGSSSFITLPANTDDLYEGANKFSWSVWVNPDSFSTQNPIFTKYSSNIALGGVQFKIDATTGKIGFFVANSSDTRVSGASDTAISTGTWSHIVAVFDGTKSISNGTNGRIRIFINGVESSFTYDNTAYTGATIPAISSSVPIRLGIVTFGGGSNTYYDGKIDQLRLFSKALSSSEVSTLYAETLATSTSLDPLSEDTTDTLQVLGDSSCIAAYRFENNEVDLSGNYNGTGAQIQYAAGRYGQAASFNGSASKVDIGSLGTTFQNNFSFSLWFNLDTIASSSITALFTTFEDYYCYAFIRDSDKKVEVRVENASTGYAIKSTSTFGTYGVWHHLAVTKSSSDGLKIYINGSLENTDGTATVDLRTINGDNLIGAYNSGSLEQYYLDGKIDQVRIFNKAISASEVTTLYNENSLVASYRFEGNANDDTRNYDGTATNVTYEYGLGFTPDFVWCKTRSATGDHNLTDSTRGVQKGLNPNTTAVEGNQAPLGVTSFDTGGFTVSDNSGGGASVNGTGQDYVAWCLKANGGTTSSNTDGTVTSTVQANTDAGFSIIKYVGNGVINQSIGHGLDSTPELYITKNLDTGGTGWFTKTTVIDGSLDELALNTTDAASNVSNTNLPTSSVIYQYNNTNLGANGQNYIVYAFHSVDSFSKIGSYTGNGSTNGPIVETGFEPAFLMVKRTDSADGWIILDNKRDLTNPRDNSLKADESAAEEVNSVNRKTDFLSNGFQLKHSHQGMNASGGTYIYMAFAADPDTEQPTVAKSFSTVTYTGTGSSQAITGLGFAPNLVWVKQRGGTTWHNIQDTINGATKHLYTNASNAQDTTANGLTSFDSDGFTLGGGNGFNGSSQNMVAWAWKADDNEPTILPNTELSSLISKYKFNDNVDDDYGDNNASPSNLSYVTGKFKKAADFNGSSSKITYPQVSPFNDSNTILAISAWVKLDSASDEFVIMSASSTSDQNVSVQLIVGGNKAGRVFISNAANNQQEIQANFGSTNNTNWNHYVWQLSSSNGIELWFNGVSQTRTQTYQAGSINTGSWFGDLTYPTDVNYATGINRVVTTAYYNGAIDQMRLFNAELTSSEISDLYNEGIEALVSANANAGFSIVKWTGTGSAGKIPHGLSAAPEMVITKRLSGASDWYTYHKDLNSGTNPAYNFIKLNSSDAEIVNASSGGSIWNSTSPSSTVINIGTSLSGSGDEYIAYCFHSVSNYSKIGSYAGTGSAGNAQNIGFQPDFVLGKSYDNPEDWFIVDNVRGGNKYLRPNLSNAESTAGASITFTSTGFQFTGGSFNNSGMNFIYMAFKIN